MKFHCVISLVFFKLPCGSRWFSLVAAVPGETELGRDELLKLQQLCVTSP